MKRRLILALTLIGSLSTIPSLVYAGSATLSWNANTESDLTGYKIYYGTRSRSYGPPIPVGKRNSYTLSGLDEGSTYYFALSALDTSNNESGLSPEVRKTIPLNPTETHPISYMIGVFRNGSWYLDSNANGLWDKGIDAAFSNFGLSSDKPLCGDWNRDGKTELGVFRKGAWYLDYNGDKILGSSSDITIRVGQFGLPDDTPIVGDWNGDGRTKIGVFRKGAWYLDSNGNNRWDPPGSANPDIAIEAGAFGLPSDIPVVGDWNGDGRAEIGVFRKGAWYFDSNGNHRWDPPGSANPDKAISAGRFGLPTDVPVVADWNGDGVADLGVFRDGKTYVDYNGNGSWDSSDLTLVFGMNIDIPFAGKW